MIYGYNICDSCKQGLRLFTAQTIKRYHRSDPGGFRGEIRRRMEYVEKDYIRKKIKLLDVMEKIERIEKNK